MTSHMNSNKTNNVESKHGDFDGEMDEIPETDLSIRVRPYIYEPLKVGVRITIIPIRKARRSQKEDPDGPGDDLYLRSTSHLS